MPEIVTCPHCTRKLRVPDELVGKKVKCPDCKEAFLAQTEAVSRRSDEADEAAPPQSGGRSVNVSTGRRTAGDDGAPLPDLSRRDEEDEDHPSRPSDDLDDDYPPEYRGSPTRAQLGWGRVRLGLSLMIYGIYGIIAGFIIMVLCIGLAAVLAVLSGASAMNALTSTSTNTGNASAAGAGAAFVAAVVIAIAGYVIFLLTYLVKVILDGIAHVFFLWIPDRSRTGRRPLAIAALSLWAVALLLPFVGYAFQCVGIFSRSGSVAGAAGLAANCTNLISSICSLAWFFVFMFFLRACALGVGNPGHARTVVIYMITVPVWVVIAFLSLFGVVCLGGAAMIGLASRSGSAGSAAGLGTGWLVLVILVYVLILIISFALWIWYVVILHQSRGAISRRLAR